MKKSRGLLCAAAVLVMVLAATALAACGSDETEASAPASPSSDVVAAAAGSDELTQFSDAVAAAGMDTTLAAEGPFTVFAASDDAVTAAGATLDGDAVQAAVIEGEAFSRADLEAGTKNDAMLADNTIVTYTGSDGSLYVNNHKVVREPLTAGNGVVYVIDGVILPKE